MTLAANKIFVTAVIVIIIAILASLVLYYNSENMQSEQISLTDKRTVFAEYENESLGIQIDYPESWIVKPTEPFRSVQFTPYTVSPEELWKNTLFVITSFPINKDNPTASEHASNYLDSLDDGFLMEKVTHKMTETTLSGMDATMVEIEVKTMGEEIRSLIYYVQTRDMIYIIGYNSPAAEYDTNLEIANKMFSSFRFI